MSALAPTTATVTCVSEPAGGPRIDALPGHLTDLGGLAIRRLLPRSRRRLVGPWCFLDSYGPLSFASGKPMDVAPHPHMGLQTVSWLLEGEILHRDSLGLEGRASSGVLNLMTAGRGIAHAEETPPQNAGRLWGVQLWVALPAAVRDTAPSFEQQRALPLVELEGGRATLIAGQLGDHTSPARTFSPLVGAELSSAAGRRLVLPLQYEFEHALIPLHGGYQLDGLSLGADTLYYLGTCRRELVLIPEHARCRALLLGGAPFGETILMWWNFVARSTEELVAARDDWEAGRRFGEVQGYDGPRLAAPPFAARPVPRS